MFKRFEKFVLAACSLAVLGTVQAIDAGKTMEEVCLENGFAVESYTLVTEDSYVVSLYRIPGTV